MLISFKKMLTDAMASVFTMHCFVQEQGGGIIKFISRIFGEE